LFPLPPSLDGGILSILLHLKMEAMETRLKTAFILRSPYFPSKDGGNGNKQGM
jgi:hypothetical protein